MSYKFCLIVFTYSSIVADYSRLSNQLLAKHSSFCIRYLNIRLYLIWWCKINFMGLLMTLRWTQLTRALNHQKFFEIPELRFTPSLSGAMVYITAWDEFVERSVQLFRADPDAVISSLFYFGSLILKPGDDTLV